MHCSLQTKEKGEKKIGIYVYLAQETGDFSREFNSQKTKQTKKVSIV
jgi:hypothetical protein